MLLLLLLGEAGGESSNAEVVGRRLAELGDQIDSMYGDHFDDIMELYNDTDQAFNTFSVVLRHVFEWDEAGFRKTPYLVIDAFI